MAKFNPGLLSTMSCYVCVEFDACVIGDIKYKVLLVIPMILCILSGCSEMMLIYPPHDVYWSWASVHKYYFNAILFP